MNVELLDDMSTDCFINILRTFIALHGPVRQMRCDQGTNVIGAANDLTKALSEMNNNHHKDFLLKHEYDFIFNTPAQVTWVAHAMGHKNL